MLIIIYVLTKEKMDNYQKNHCLFETMKVNSLNIFFAFLFLASDLRFISGVNLQFSIKDLLCFFIGKFVSLYEC